MSYNGSGLFQLPLPPVVSGTVISSTWANTTLNQIASGLSTAICKDGQQTVTQNIPFASKKLTLVGNATLTTDVPNAAQVQNSALIYLDSVSGTNTITASFAGGVTPLAYTAGQMFSIVPAATNTAATTLAPGSLAAKNIFANGAACVGGELILGVPAILFYDGTQLNIISGSGSTAATPPTTGAPLGNGYITATAAANAITIALKATGGTDATTSNPIFVVLRNATASTGTMTAYPVAAALSTVITSGSTLGCASSEKVRIHVGAIQNASTGIELFYWTATVGSLKSIYKPDTTGFVTTTAEGGAGGADSAQTPYSTTARTAQPWRYLGYIEATSGATAGQWASINNIVNWLPGVPMPGDTVGLKEFVDGVLATGSGATVPADNTKPQVSEGDQYMSNSYIQLSNINKLKFHSRGYFSAEVDNSNTVFSLFINGAADSVATDAVAYELAGDADTPEVYYTATAGATSPVVATVRAGCTPGVTGSKVIYFNGLSPGTGLFDGNLGSFLNIYELQS